jgi:hypothetical protein
VPAKPTVRTSTSASSHLHSTQLGLHSGADDVRAPTGSQMWITDMRERLRPMQPTQRRHEWLMLQLRATYCLRTKPTVTEQLSALVLPTVISSGRGSLGCLQLN